MNKEKEAVLKAVEKDRRTLLIFVVLMLANALLCIIMVVDEPGKKLRLLGSGLTTIGIGFFVYSTKRKINKGISRYEGMG